MESSPGTTQTEIILTGELLSQLMQLSALEEDPDLATTLLRAVNARLSEIQDRASGWDCTRRTTRLGVIELSDQASYDRHLRRAVVNQRKVKK